MNKWLVLSVGLFAACAISPVQAKGDPAAGQAKSASCSACHGMDGNSVNPEWPKLAGQHAGYLNKQLYYFTEGDRDNATMKGMSANLTEQDRQDLSAYYASQEATIGAADPKLVDFGEKIYRGGNEQSGVAPCMGCHGPSGAGNPAALYPALRGQHATYTENQLRGFASGKRVNENAKKMMQILASRMTEREIRAVASYIQGLH